MWFELETTNQACLLQSIVGVAGGATRAALTVHQARRDNMADISAKDGSQVHDSVSTGVAANLLLVIVIVLFKRHNNCDSQHKQHTQLNSSLH